MLRRQPLRHPIDRHLRDDPAADRTFGRQRRLRAAAEFAKLLQASPETTIRSARRYLSVIASCSKASDERNLAGPVRFGVIVARRNAPRAVDRVLVKRVVREACRHHARTFEQMAATAAVCIRLALRLKSPLLDEQGRELAMRQWRRDLRAEADSLLRYVLAELPLRAHPATSNLEQ